MQTFWPALKIGKALNEVCRQGPFLIRNPSMMGETKPLTSGNLGQMVETKPLPLEPHPRKRQEDIKMKTALKQSYK